MTDCRRVSLAFFFSSSISSGLRSALKEGMLVTTTAGFSVKQRVKPLVYIKKKIQPTIVNIFLPIIFSICFGCSKEPSHCSKEPSL